MADILHDRSSSKDTLTLSGTTLRVYRYLYRAGRPCGIHEIQRGLKLSSSSVALYHVRKLLEAGLIREEGRANSASREMEAESDETLTNGPKGSGKGNFSGYVVDRIIFENMIRIRRSLIPLQVAYAVFFVVALAILLSILRPATLSGAYVFAVIIISISVGIFIYQAIRSVSKTSIA